MNDANDLVRIIKQAAMEAVNNSKPVDYTYGKVTGVDPLKIKIDQKLVLPAEVLVLGSLVNGTVGDELKTGEKVIMIQKAGGQEFFILDRRA